ncbi:MAG: hypothetical protein MZV65_47425 [Chromatiales bacterium]|nr:hypothetical protein [Chromatiales bacterium]
MLLQTDWREFASHLLAHLDEHQDELPWLILVDELPIFGFGPAGARRCSDRQRFLLLAAEHAPEIPPGALALHRLHRLGQRGAPR